MKRLITLLLFGLMVSVMTAQNRSDLPNIILEDLDGNPINVSQIDNNGKPFVLAFWATWCIVDYKQFNAWTSVYKKWVKETGVKIIAVSLNDKRDRVSIKPAIERHGWPFDVLLDEDRELGKAMGVEYPPMYFLFDGQGKLVFQKLGYREGEEEILYQELLKVYSDKPSKKGPSHK